MKYLQNKAIEEITSILSDCPVHSTRKLNGRLEVYTMKRTNSDKKYAAQLYKSLLEEAKVQLSLQNQYQSIVANQNSSNHHNNRTANNNKNSRTTNNKSNKNNKNNRTTNNKINNNTNNNTNKKKKRKRSLSVNDCLLPLADNPPTDKRRPRVYSFDVCSVQDPNAMQQQQQQQQQNELPRKLFTDLILTLNHSFPDYDFGASKVSDFLHVPLPRVIRELSQRFADLSRQLPTFLPQLWSAMDMSIGLNPQQTIVYRYQPPSNGCCAFLESLVDNNTTMEQQLQQPSSTTTTTTTRETLWSFNYLFVNKACKRILLFYSLESMVLLNNNDQEEEEDDDDTALHIRNAEEDCGATPFFFPHKLNTNTSTADDCSNHSEDATTDDFDMDPDHIVVGGIPVHTA